MFFFGRDVFRARIVHFKYDIWLVLFYEGLMNMLRSFEAQRHFL